jgi:preprotein translocase YajC subunit
MDSIWVIALAYPAIIAALFYFAFLRPVQQHQKKQRNELQSLRVGDEVLTQAGFIARIKEVRVPEGRGHTELVLDLGGFEVKAVASAIVERVQHPANESATAETADAATPAQARGHS